MLLKKFLLLKLIARVIVVKEQILRLFN